MATNKKKKKKNHLPLRLNLLFLFVFLLFSVLVLRLGVVQIVNGQNYIQKVANTQQVTASLAPARGKILDDKGVVLADNKAELAVVYTRVPGTTDQDHLQIAKKLVKLLNVTKDMTSQVTQRDMQDYWITVHDHGPNNNAYTMKLSKKEQGKSDAYQILLNRITAQDLKSITPQDMKVIAIKRELDQSTNLSPHYIKVGLSKRELARVGEHKAEFGGRIDTAVASTRVYPNGQYFFLGKVGQIPSENLDEYLAKGYQQNDLVGTTFLEQEYEDVLRGNQTQYKYTTRNGQPVGSPQKIEGSRGDDIVLSVDSKLQNEIGKILENDIKADLQTYSIDRGYLNSAYVVMMDPNTGGIKAMVGRTMQPNGKFVDSSYGAVFNSFQIGSSVKGATELTGYQHHAIPGTIVDKPFHFQSGKDFKSWTTLGTVNQVTALRYSSNIYMGTIVSRMAGFGIKDMGSYYQVSTPSGPRYRRAVKEFRDGLSQFGLGIKTGVDLPSEGTGYNGGIPDQPGLLIQYSIGQFDTYTPLQMAQYVSTIANGGYRLQPHFLEQIRQPNPNPDKLGPVLQPFRTNILNRIKNPESQINSVKQGFYEVTHAPDGTAAVLGQYPYSQYMIAAKTGTAQTDTSIVPNVYNLALVGYSPYNNPKIAIAIMVPSVRSSGINEKIAEDVFTAYYKLYPPIPGK